MTDLPNTPWEEALLRAIRRKKEEIARRMRKAFETISDTEDFLVELVSSKSMIEQYGKEIMEPHISLRLKKSSEHFNMFSPEHVNFGYTFTHGGMPRGMTRECNKMTSQQVIAFTKERIGNHTFASFFST